LTKVRAEQDQVLLLAPGVPGEALGPRCADESKSAVAHEPGKADKGLPYFFARHALDGVATDGLDGADPFHADPSIPPAQALTPLYARKKKCCARGERPRRRAAKRGYEFSPSDVDCHATLPWGVMPMQWRDATTLSSRGL